MNLCLQVRHLPTGAVRSRDYIEESRFHDAGIDVVYMDYSGYREYPQLFGSFLHDVSILDLIFNTGDAAGECLKTIDPASRLPQSDCPH